LAEYRAIEGKVGEEHIIVKGEVKQLSVPDTLTNVSTQGRAVIQVKDAPLLYSINGEDPFPSTITRGHELAPRDLLIVTGSELGALKMVRKGVKDSILHVRYERRIN